MNNFYRPITLSLFALLLSFSTFAQKRVEVPVEVPTQKPLKDSLYLSKKQKERQTNYESYLYPFPGKKKDMWSIGVNGGMSYIFGNVTGNPGWGAGLTVQKAFGHVFSLRLQGLYASTTGLDYINTGTATAKNYRNYKTDAADVTLQGVFSLNNINFYKKQPKVIFNLIVGVGGMMQNTKYDKLDANGNPYDFSTVPDVNSFSDRKKATKAIKAILDGKYETPMTDLEAHPHFGNWRLNPTLMVGAGLAFRLSKRVDLNIEERVSWHNTDLLDGYQGGNKTDLFSYTSVGIAFNIGKRAEPRYWTNPLVTPYNDIMNLKANLEGGDFLKDDDGDGIPNVLDKDLNTPPNVAVNTKGQPLDSDGDGIPDYKDAEPFSPKGAKVDKNGVALDTDKDGVKDIFDKEENTPAGALADAKGLEIKLADVTAKIPAAQSEIAIVYFNLNSAEIKPEFYPELYKVAEFAKNNPSVNMVITGNTDVRADDKYNMQLSEKRAQKCLEILTTDLQVDKNRFEIVAKGKTDPLIKNIPPRHDPKTEGKHYLNRRVVFTVK